MSGQGGKGAVQHPHLVTGTSHPRRYDLHASTALTAHWHAAARCRPAAPAPAAAACGRPPCHFPWPVLAPSDPFAPSAPNGCHSTSRAARQPVALLLPQAVDKVLHDALPVLCDDGLWMELHALDVGVLPVAHAHDGAVLRPRGHLQLGGAVVLLDDQAVIAAGLEGAVGRRGRAAGDLVGGRVGKIEYTAWCGVQAKKATAQQGALAVVPLPCSPVAPLPLPWPLAPPPPHPPTHSLFKPLQDAHVGVKHGGRLAVHHAAGRTHHIP